MEASHFLSFFLILHLYFCPIYSQKFLTEEDFASGAELKMEELSKEYKDLNKSVVLKSSIGLTSSEAQYRYGVRRLNLLTTYSKSLMLCKKRSITNCPGELPAR